MEIPYSLETDAACDEKPDRESSLRKDSEPDFMKNCFLKDGN